MAELGFKLATRASAVSRAIVCTELKFKLATRASAVSRAIVWTELEFKLATRASAVSCAIDCTMKSSWTIFLPWTSFQCMWSYFWSLITCSLFFFCFFFFYLAFMALSRIFRLYWANRSGKNWRTRGKTTCPIVSRTWLSHMWPEQCSNHSSEKPNGLRVNSPIH